MATRGAACMCHCVCVRDAHSFSYLSFCKLCELLCILIPVNVVFALCGVCVCVFVLPASFGWKLSLSLSNRIGRTPAANAACCHQVVHLKQHWSDCWSLLENGASRGRAELPRVPFTPAFFHWLNTGKCFSLYLVSTLISHCEFGVTLYKDLKGDV